MAISYAKYFTTPTQSVTDTVEEPVNNEVSSDDLPGENSVDFSRYGVTENGNTVGFTKLNKLMDDDGVGVDSQKRYEVQQKWLANFDAKWGNSTDQAEQEKYQKTRENILSRALQENGVFNQIGQAWDRNKDAVAGQIEGVYDGGVSRLSQSDEELLKKADPELYKLVQAYGGLNRVRGTLMSEDDLSGVGSMMAFGDTPLDMNFAKEVQQKIDNLRAKDVMNRANQEAVTVIGKDGKEQKVSRMQADKIANSRPSQIVGDEAAAKQFEDNPLSMFYDTNVARHALGLSVGSTVRNLPTTISGAVLSVANPYLGMAVMNTGNLTDQEYSAVQDAIDKGFKAKYGENYDPAKISAQEWLEMTNTLADKGDIAKASAEGYTTGALMTLAGTATGGVVEKFGISKIAKMTPKSLAGKIAKWGGLGSLSLSDEGIQEVAETMVENARKGDPIDKGLSQAFLLGMFSVENISHKGASGVGHLVRKAKEKVQENDNQAQAEGESKVDPQENPIAEQSTTTQDQQVEQTTETAATTSQVQADSELDRASELLSNIERNVNGEYVNESGENTALLDPQGAIQQQFGQFNAELDQIMSDKGYDPTDPESRKAFVDMLNSRTGNVNVIAGTDAIIEEARPLYDKLRAGTITDEEATRLGELEQQYQEETTQEIDGLTVNRNLQVDVANQPQDNVNEDRNINRDGTENADGSSIEQGLNEPNGSGTQSSSEVSDTVSPTETTTTTTGDSQSDTGAIADIAEQQDNNSQPSGAVGVDGRTGNTVGQGVEQGTSGQNRVTQTGEPTETTQSGSENSGVQQRTQSDSVGETLTRSQSDTVSKYEFGLKRKNKNSVTFTEHQDGTVSAEIRANGGIYNKNLRDMPTAKAWVDQTLVGSDNKMWNGKTRKLVDGDGVFNERDNDRSDSTPSEPRQERQSTVSDKRITDNSPSDTAAQSKPVKQERATKSERKDDSKGGKPVDQQMPDPIKRENDRKRAVDNAVAMAAEQVNPYVKEFTGDFKANQKKARQLYLEHKDNQAEIDKIREAYLGKHTNAKWGVIENGYNKFSLYNTVHRDLTKHLKHKPYGIDFDGNFIYKNEKEIYKDLQQENTTASQITLTLAEEPQTAATAVEKAATNFFKKDDNRKVEQDMRKAVEDYAEEHNYREEDGSVIQGTDENLAWAANNDHFLEWVGNKLRPFFEKLRKVVAAVVAVVAVGAMTVPTDAMAQQGFSTYTQGEIVQGVSQEASNTINWVKQHKDHNGKNFVIADKDQGKIHIVSPDGKVLDTQNALFGKGRGNDNSDMNTPSGRMQLKKETKLNKTERGIYGDSVLEFVQPETKASVKQKGGGLLAMHRVVNKPERKAALNSATASDNYLSHGCVNIPTAFYNTAVDSLDGAMVYVLDHKEPKQAKQATKEVKQTTTQSGLTYSKSSLTQSPSGLKMQRSGLSVQTPSKLSIAEVNYDEHGLSKPEVKKTLNKVLGDLSDRVTLISREDFDAHNADYAYINRNGVEGFFDAETGSVFLVADQIKKGNGLTAPERAAWVAWHELTHAGLDTKYGNDLKQILENVKDDPFISQLAEAIQLRRASRNDSPAHVSDLGAVEEAIAEINAAVRTGKLNALTERYGLVIPEAYHDFAKEVSNSFLQKLRNLFNKLLGRTAVVSNNQVVELLRSLPQDVEAYAPVASLAITERVLSQLNNPESAYRQAKYSIGETVAETANKAANYILSNTLYKNQQVLNTAGANPNAVGVGKRQDEVLEQSLNPMEKFIEGMYDSQTAAVKHLGGLKTRYGQMLKTATNRTSQVKTMFQKDLFHLLKNMEKVAKKAYTREDRVAIQNDLQTITTALGSLSGINSKMMANYERILFDPDYGLETELQSLGVDLETGQANQVMSPWQAKQIGEMWQRYQEMKTIYEKSSQSVNRLMDEKLARKGEDPKRMREDLRMYNGQTTAESYNRITKAVKAGLLDVSVKGKLWLDYIKDVGFTEDKGFADESKNYDINEKDIELNGHLAPLIDEYTSFAQSIYNYKEQHLGKALVGESFDNRFEVPTMGKVESMKFNVDQDDNFRVKKDKKVEDIVSLADATEYQSKRLGRALLGGNVISNLNTLIDLTAQQTQYQSLFQALYDQRNDKDAVSVKVFNTTDPEYNLMKGAILYVDILGRNGKPTGKKKYVKVALDNDEATAALFGDNVQEMNITGMNLVRFINKFITMSLTGNPAFSLWNSLRGLWEKLDQVSSQFGGKDNAYFMEQIQNSNSATAKLIKSNNAIASFLRKPALVGIALAKIARNFFSYIPAASAMAFYMIDKKGKHKHGNLLVGKQKLMFNRLMQAYQQGTISTRAESYRLTPEQLQAMHSSYRGVLGNTFGTAFKSLPRKGVMMLDSLQEYAQFLTTTGELVSTLAIQDVLTDAGMDIDRANEANLFFMNFNDKGAGRASAYLRAAIPFANATAQGNRSTMRSITSKGVSLILYGAVSSYLLQGLSNMLQDLMPCDKDVSDNAFENRNDAELQRDIPFRLGCSGEFRLPIGYGIGAISHSIGVGLYQLANNNWSGEQALKFASHVAAENLLPLPTIPDSKSSPVSIAVKTIAPYPVRVFMNANAGVDDFGNELSSPAAKGKKNRYAFGKATTPEVWTDVAKFLHGVGFNASPEEARYVFQSILGEIPAGLMNDASKDLKEDETRLGQIAYGLSGGKRIWRKARTPGQDSYIRATNLQDRYEDLVKYIDHAHEVGDENGKLKYGTRDSNLYTWLNKVRATGQYNEREMEIMQYLAEFKREQKRISSKKLTKERKDELHYENNKRLIEMLRPYNKGDK